MSVCDPDSSAMLVFQVISQPYGRKPILGDRFSMLEVADGVWVSESYAQYPTFSLDIQLVSRLERGKRIHVYCRRDGSTEELLHLGSITRALPRLRQCAEFEMPPPSFAIQIVCVIREDTMEGEYDHTMWCVPSVSDLHRGYELAFERITRHGQMVS
jgi:hypothetical protein